MIVFVESLARRFDCAAHSVQKWGLHVPLKDWGSSPPSCSLCAPSLTAEMLPETQGSHSLRRVISQTLLYYIRVVSPRFGSTSAAGTEG